MATIHALKTFHTDGKKQYPIYLGFLPAEQLARISEVPSFDRENTNDEIAKNILHPPVTNWQRPIIEEKWRAIKDKFSRPGELMPNPVLLAVADTSKVTVTQQVLNGQQTNIFEIDVPESPTSKPLWILDGQHRVRGMSESENRGNPMPLVLLYGEGQHAYSPQQFAKVFAEVTTSATPLDSLHGTWLRYAFKLDEFASPADGGTTDAWQAMTAAATLCSVQVVGRNSDANPYFDKVQLNPELTPKPAIGEGFAYGALALQEIFQREYFAQPGATLSPDSFAEQVSLATLALSSVSVTPTVKSAFFGDAQHRSKYLQDAFLVGACRYLAVHGVPRSWVSVLEALEFNSADWDISIWVGSTGGSAGNISKKVANAIFAEAFTGAALPTDVSDLPTYLQGDQSEIVIRTASVLPSGRPKTAGATRWSWPVSGNKTINLDGQTHVKLVQTSANVGKLDCVDLAAPHDNQFSVSSLKRGIVLPPGGGTVRLQIRAHYFGDTSADLRLNLTWK